MFAHLFNRNLMDIYTSLVMPIMEYACLVWHAALPNITTSDKDIYYTSLVRTIMEYDCPVWHAALPNIPTSDKKDIYTSLVRQIMEYDCLVWNVALLQTDVESVQRRDIPTIYWLT